MHICAVSLIRKINIHSLQAKLQICLFVNSTLENMRCDPIEISDMN